MKNLQFRVPDGIHSQLKRLASQEGVSLNRLLVVAASNEVVRNETRDFFRQDASAYHADDFARALAAIPDAPVEADGESARASKTDSPPIEFGGLFVSPIQMSGRNQPTSRLNCEAESGTA